jgi:hypothetical protein
VKKILTVVFLSLAVVAVADVTYTFSGQSGTFDGTTNQVQVLLTDGGIDFLMTVSSLGGNLKALTGDFGIDGLSGTNDQLDGTDEILTISFNKAVNFISMDLAGIGSNADDGASLKVGTASVVLLHTGSPSSAVFNGTSDIYTPASPVRVDIGESIILTGSAATSAYELEAISLQVIPEPATMSLIGLAGLFAMLARRIRLRT